MLALCHVSEILDDEMDDIENFVNNGGTLYVSGPIGHPRLAKMLGIRFEGVCNGAQTEESFTYLDPTPEGEKLLDGFSALAPLSVPMKQYLIDFDNDTDGEKDTKVYATLTLPYTVPGTPKFSAIHSNPPGIHTGKSAIIERKAGKGKILYVSAPIEIAKPYMSRQVVGRIMEHLVGEGSFISNAPKMVETLCWEKDDSIFFALLNEQEEAPIIPIYDISVGIKGQFSEAEILTDGTKLPIEYRDGISSVVLPPVKVFTIVRLSK